MRTFSQKHNQPLEPESSSLARSNMSARGVHQRADPIVHLQGEIGNQALQRKLQTDAEEFETGLTGTASPRLGHDFSRIPIYRRIAGAIQAKLAINQPGDTYEQEADRVSEQVMRLPDPRLQRTSCACGGGCPRCQKEQPGDRHELLQTKQVQAGQITATPIVHEVLASPGQPLHSAARGFMEPRFGHDFSKLRVHTDAKAVESARSVNALAYTVGRHVVFGEGQYSPNSMAGRQLLAHELTHVIQQQGMPADAGSVQRKDMPPKVPTYRDCTEATTFSSKPNQDLETARVFASNLVDAAIGAIATNDGSETYRTALARHFIAPTFDERKDIFRSFRRIWFYLKKPENIRCASSDEDVDACESNPEAGVTQAFVEPGRQDTVLCSTFWLSRLPCQAITLIHEAAHGLGMGLAAAHPPNRGSAEYPSLAGNPSAGETTSARMSNPSAFAYFAAHIGRETDTQCFGIPASRRGAIDIQDVAPQPGKK